MESEAPGVYVLDGMAQEALAMDVNDEDLSLDLFELMGTNCAIATGTATFEEFLEKLLARSSKQ